MLKPLLQQALSRLATSQNPDHIPEMRPGLLILFFSLPCFGQEPDSATVLRAGQNAFSLPLPNITRENRRAHVVGNSFFNRNWVAAPSSSTARDGLGPLFHTQSCSGCHLRDGRSAPDEEGIPLPGLLFRFSREGRTESHPQYGRQLAPNALPDWEKEPAVKITWEEVSGSFADSTRYTLRKPTYEFADEEFRVAPRLAPPVFGLGLLEAIPDEHLLSRHDPNDEDEDGISGRAHFYQDPETGKPIVARFGWKANQIDLRHQTAAAFVDDMGLTSSLHPREDVTDTQKKNRSSTEQEPEVSDRILDRVVVYLKTLAPPPRATADDPSALRGEKLFSQIGCAACHAPEWKTAESVPGFPELENQLIHPYTDLLLHDMGEDLADDRADSKASPSEWRTPPLWGIGLTKTVNGHTFFLHDGRARNIEEAILWHGGEAERSRDAYRELEGKDRGDLLRFLNSL